MASIESRYHPGIQKMMRSSDTKLYQPISTTEMSHNVIQLLNINAICGIEGVWETRFLLLEMKQNRHCV